MTTTTADANHTAVDTSGATAVQTPGTTAAETPRDDWGRHFDPERLATLELEMWKAYYRGQGARLFALLVRANHEQAGVGWLRAFRAAFFLARAAVRFGRSTGDYERFEPDIVKGYQILRLPRGVDAAEVARRELRWWVVRREVGLAAGDAAGDAITALYSVIYRVPESAVREAGSLRGEAAEVRDRGAAADPHGPGGAGGSYWPDVDRLLRASYRSLRAAVALEPGGDANIEEGDTRAVASNEYHFITTWLVPATPEEISAVLGDAEGLPRWWPSVYLDVRVLEPGAPDGVGRLVGLYTKGWLPYSLRWQFRVTSSDVPRGFSLEAIGDFVGRGIWTLTPERTADAPQGPLTSVQYDWKISAQKGVLRIFSFAMKPVFSANHHWAMAQGEKSLLLELARRHAANDPLLLAAIPAPPGPTFPHNLRRRPRRPRA
jgi:hypothetical protein